MTTKPFYNALAASGYVVFVVLLINKGSRLVEDAPENLLMPIGMLSLFVLSAAMMAYIFLYQPILMIVDGERKEGIKLFLHTVAIFATITFSILLASVILIR